MLSKQRLAVLGTGKMGGAIVKGLINSGALPASSITIYDIQTDKGEELAAQLGTSVASSAPEAVADATIVLAALVPQIVTGALAQLSDSLGGHTLVLSIAAGVTVARLQESAGPDVPVIRAMPNTPCLIGEGITAVCRGKHVSNEHLKVAQTLFSAVGRSVVLEERLMDAVTGLSGSGPAYVYLMIEAMADGGVKAGLPRDTALLLAAQTVFGAAKMVLETGDHPAQLKDRVASPGGTTIAGLAALEKKGFRSALIEAIEAAASRSKELSQ